MKRTFVLFTLILISMRAHSEEIFPPKNQIASASAVITVPVMANTPGAFGGIFKTKVVVFNPTGFSYPIEVSLYSVGGLVNKKTINMSAGQIRNYENFLEEVFAFAGAGTVNFDSLSVAGGAPNRVFFVSAEVYIDSDKGRLKTVVTAGIPLDPISPAINAYSTGITVDSSTRTNLGCFNASFNTNAIIAELYDSSNRLLTTIPMTLTGGTWNQVPLPTFVTGGYIRWKPNSSAYCYAVVVNNASNDGTFISAVNYVP